MMKKNTKQVLVNTNHRKEFHSLLDQLFDACYIDILTGKFRCKKCDNVVHIDLSQKLVHCPIHGLLI